eukprot:scaffold20196_cov69-Phaeocystis_antarctica.AAC.5
MKVLRPVCLPYLWCIGGRLCNKRSKASSSESIAPGLICSSMVAAGLIPQDRRSWSSAPRKLHEAHSLPKLSNRVLPCRGCDRVVLIVVMRRMSANHAHVSCLN